MPAIEGGQLAFAVPFNHSKYRRIYESDILIGVTIENLPDADVILRDEVFHKISPGFYVSHQGDHRTPSEPFGNQIVNFGKNWRGQHERFVCLLDQCPAPLVIFIAPVHRGIKRPRIQDQRQDRGGIRRVARTAAVLERAAFPTPRLRGLTLSSRAFSANASLTTSEKETPRSSASLFRVAIV